ncbi:hypothetical protein GCM10009616_18300 [Microlunatus lacustris]
MAKQRAAAPETTPPTGDAVVVPGVRRGDPDLGVFDPASYVRRPTDGWTAEASIAAAWTFADRLAGGHGRGLLAVAWQAWRHFADAYEASGGDDLHGVVILAAACNDVDLFAREPLFNLKDVIPDA